jgi:hypothetical protein
VAPGGQAAPDGTPQKNWGPADTNWQQSFAPKVGVDVGVDVGVWVNVGVGVTVGVSVGVKVGVNVAHRPESKHVAPYTITPGPQSFIKGAAQASWLTNTT